MATPLPPAPQCILVGASMSFLVNFLKPFWVCFGVSGEFFSGSQGSWGVLGKHLGGMLTSRPIFLDFWVRLGGQDEVPKIIFMLKNFSRGPPGGSGRGFRRVFKTQFNIEVSWHRFLIDFGEVWGWPRVALDCALLYYRALRVF